MDPATPSFSKADCDLIARYGPARIRWSRVDAAGKRKLLALRSRIKATLALVAEQYEGTVEIRTFLGPAYANGSVPRDYFGCIYPAVVPNKAFGLQFALIVSATGVELCFCMGAERREVRNPETAAINRRVLEEAQQQLAHLPPHLIASVEARLGPAWRFRAASRQPAKSNDFETFGDWVQYAASPLGAGASVSCNVTAKALDKSGSVLAERMTEMMRLFAPVFEYVYAPEVVANAISSIDASANASAFGTTAMGAREVREQVEGREHPSTNVRVEVNDEDPRYRYGTRPAHEGSELAVHDRIAPGYGVRTESTTTPLTPFSVSDATADLFVPRDEFDGFLSLLGSKKNLILEGAPGVGKTFLAQRLAYALLGERDRSRVEMVQFHQSYAYEDFVQGWRPAAGGGFVLRNGVFYEFARSASRDPERPYVFIIDEINRGNVSKIFGELMLLLERDKRGEGFAVPLTYALSRNDRFFLPPNLYFVGTMNTADRSLAMVDYALRRRFAFARLQPAFGSKVFAKYLSRQGVPRDLVKRIVQRMTALNEEILEDRKRLGVGFEIGHSFFVPPDKSAHNSQYNDQWYRTIILSEIEPLLREYWFDDPERVAELTAQLLL